MKISRPIASMLLASAISLTGCKKPAVADTRSSTRTESAPVASAINLATAGKVGGIVSFAGKPPARVPIDVSMDPVCNLTAEANQTEQVLVTDHRLANVYVYLKAGAPASFAQASAPAVVMDQKGCRYVPHVVAVQQGGAVEFRNSDPTMHNIHTMTTMVANESVDLTEGPAGTPQSAAQTRRFNAAETLIAVRCNNHPWMNAFINVAPNQWFAVTGADGSFTLPDLPPGTYTLAAVHETLGEQDQQITVGPKATVKTTFSFSGK